MNNKDFPYIILPKATIRPNKIVFYNQFIKKQEKVSEMPKKEPIPCEIPTKQTELSFAGFPVYQQNFEKNTQITEKQTIKKLPEKNKHNFEISKKASARIKEKVSWLYTLAKNQTVITHTGKTLYSFKMNFITLTLPALQKHTTAEITSQCLNQFLTECKVKFGLSNYVWRLEFQKNGNAHYHIATDCFLEYKFCKALWNRILEKLSYVSDYKEKFSKMSFQEYYKMFHNNEKDDFKKLKDRYYKGVSEKWENPNTVDCRVVTSAKNIAFYIAKYITKKSDVKLNAVVSEREPKETNLRLWFCCRSLSKLEKIEIFLDEVNYLTDEIIEKVTVAKHMIYDYCQVVYFNLKEQTNEMKKNLWLLYNNYAKELGYFK